MATKIQDSSNENAVLRRVQNGESDLFYQLVQPWERAVFLAALGIVNNEADAEDVAQEAILKAFRNVSRFRGESKFSTWLIQITINEARMRVRKRRSCLYDSLDDHQQTMEGDYIPKDFADWREIPLQALESKHLRLAIREALDRLPEKYRSVFVLRDIDSRYPVRHNFPPGGSGERAASSLSRITGYRRSHRRRETTPNYSLNHARSGSDTRTLNFSTAKSISPLRSLSPSAFDSELFS
ncbi:MAG: polymerase, sigma-24 subunit, subfamily [Acidobacteriaceae bacterium]|nr:polymerase, sigma-24 subunit, subfamily [Acidobacteriaceae bacterium]